MSDQAVSEDLANSESGLTRPIADAVAAWGKTVFGAPRNLPALIVGPPTVRDEVIERVFTHVVLRTVGEMVTTTRETRSTSPRVDASRLDPFAFTAESLKSASEYVRQCETCGASGSSNCQRCGGGGQMSCGTCDGSGQELKHYKTVASKRVKCKNCKATGRVLCTGCVGSGTTPCVRCRGSGHMLTWLTFTQTDHVQVTVHPESPIVIAHPPLREGRELAMDELGAFAIVREASGTKLDLERLTEAERSLPRIHLDAVNPRLERVTRQQYVKLAVVRRDVVYEMCGSRGTIVLSGNRLAPSTTADAVGPIRKRLWAWGALTVVVAAIAALLRVTFIGETAYFASARGIALGLGLLSTALAVIALGSVLRSWRGGTRFWPIGKPIFGAAVASGLSLVGICIVGLLVRPSVGEARDALASRDPTKARLVIDALKTSGARSPDVLEAEDLVKLAEAKALTGDARLAVLDDVAARHGSSAIEAAAAARGDRLAAIRKLNASRDSQAALDAADRWFPLAKGAADAEVAEERARAHEIAGSACPSEPCRLVEATNANLAHGTPERANATQVARLALLNALDPKAAGEKDVAERLKHLRVLGATAMETRKSLEGDVELHDPAAAALAFAESERAKVALLLSPLPVVEELLGAKATTRDKVATIVLEGLTAYVALDGAGRCAGVYAVGDGDRRHLPDSGWSAEHLLGQSIGRAAKIRQPTPQGSTATSRWYEAGVPVIARWHDSALVELRIGDATP